MTNREIREIKEFLKPSDEHDAEVIGVYEAFITGKCDDCKYLKDCSTYTDFEFPSDAWCMKRKKQILDEWRN